MIVQIQARSSDALIGDAIRKRRLALGISQAEIGERVRQSGNYIELVEQGILRPEPTELGDMATMLQCRLSDFFREVLNKNADTM